MTEETKINKITESLDREVLTSLTVTPKGSVIDNYNQLLDVAKTMSTAKFGIPSHLRGNPGDCLAIREIAMDKGLSPYLLARHCYVVNDMLCFDGQAVHAIVEKSGRLAEPLMFTYEGEGDTRTCSITGILRGGEKRTYTTPPKGEIKPQNSPLWKQDPDQQLAYLGVRRWSARYCPAALLGIYSREEMLDTVIDVTPEPQASPKLMERLPGRIEGEGFEQATAETAQEEAAALNKAEAVKAKRADILKKAREAKKAKASAEPPGEGLKPGGGRVDPAPGKALQQAAQDRAEALKEAGVSPLTWVPTNKAEYVEYARAMIEVAPSPLNWFLSEKQAKLRQACKVDDLTVKLLHTLAVEGAG